VAVAQDQIAAMSHPPVTLAAEALVQVPLNLNRWRAAVVTIHDGRRQERRCAE
jgi:hypothetical protein